MSRSKAAFAGHSRESHAATPAAAPDLLHVDARLGLDPENVQTLLELSFLGREAAKDLDRVLAGVTPEADWNLDLFAEDLFVRELIHDCFELRVEGLRYPVNEEFLFQVFSAPPTDIEAIRFRQEILRELAADETLLRRAERLYVEVSKLLAMFKTPDHAQRLDIHSYRLDVFRQAKGIIDRMAEGFAGATSGLHRLAETGKQMRRTRAYRRMSDLLDYEQHQSRLRVSVQIGGDGEIKDLRILDIRDNEENPHYLPHWRRLWHRFRAFFYGYKVSKKVILHRLLGEMFVDVAPSLVPLVQILGHLEVYLTAHGFARRMGEEGLDMCLADLGEGKTLRLEQLFNPLLLATEEPPQPCSLAYSQDQQITLVTGPNSGGKTRLLQSLGLIQVLGQSGMYVPAAAAELPLVHGLFVSLVETEDAHQGEGRLGREMMRIRRLFTTMGTPSLVILDELCSGTNPKEGIEIFDLVLRLLERLDTQAVISTHFLDYAQRLHDERPVRGMEFLQVEVAPDLSSTYQFIPGVAETSLAAETAQRLGVTFEELAELIDQRKGHDVAETLPDFPATLPRPETATAG
ncbi:MAG: DNA mismatch repair protein [Thermoanaerobaculia bacterium]|nr:DNA mismatch repair protein [Thermoanaerobaculia bacterium]